MRIVRVTACCTLWRVEPGRTVDLSRDPSNVHRNKVVRLADLAIAADEIAEQVFEDCEIVGPAVIVPTGSQFRDCTWEGDLDALLWRLAPGQNRVIGAIKVSNCLFERCRLRRIGVAGTDEALETFKRGFPVA